MSVFNWWWGVVLVVFAVALAFEVALAWKYRRLPYYIGVAILAYGTGIMLFVVFLEGVGFYFVRSGLFTAILLIMLLCLHAIDIIDCDGK